MGHPRAASVSNAILSGTDWPFEATRTRRCLRETWRSFGNSYPINTDPWTKSICWRLGS